MTGTLTDDHGTASQARPASGMATLRVRAGDGVQTLQVPQGTSVLEIAIEADTGLTFVCCRGACGACLVRVASRARNLSPKTPTEQKLLGAIGAPHDARLACQCSILGDVEIESIDPCDFRD